MTAIATAHEETPSLWTVTRLFRCSACTQLFTAPRLLGRPERCPECGAYFDDRKEAHA